MGEPAVGTTLRLFPPLPNIFFLVQPFILFIFLSCFCPSHPFKVQLLHLPTLFFFSASHCASLAGLSWLAPPAPLIGPASAMTFHPWMAWDEVSQHIPSDPRKKTQAGLAGADAGLVSCHSSFFDLFSFLPFLYWKQTCLCMASPPWLVLSAALCVSVPLSSSSSVYSKTNYSLFSPCVHAKREGTNCMLPSSQINLIRMCG